MVKIVSVVQLKKLHDLAALVKLVLGLAKICP